jgi:hypothetical protein
MPVWRSHCRASKMVSEVCGSKMKDQKPQAVIVTAIIVVLTFIFWLEWILLDFVVADWSSPPAAERSVPAVKTY